MPGPRSYDDPCGIARALDLIGERWALLIVRELLFGPKRFTDLRRGLPHASQNVLAQRLRELTQAGIVHRHRLGPPASAWGYELTARGYRLEPVLLELARWGSQAPLASRSELSVDALMLALRTTFARPPSEAAAARFTLRLAEDRFCAEIADGRLTLVRGEADRPDAIIETDPVTLRSLVFGGRPLANAVADESVRVHGDQSAAQQFVTSFSRPAPPPG